MKSFRGNTIPLRLKCTKDSFHTGDKIKMVVVKNIGEEALIVKDFVIEEDTKVLYLNLSSQETKKLKPGDYLMEAKVATNYDYVTRGQGILSIKESAINE